MAWSKLDEIVKSKIGGQDKKQMQQHVPNQKSMWQVKLQVKIKDSMEQHGLNQMRLQELKIEVKTNNMNITIQIRHNFKG